MPTLCLGLVALTSALDALYHVFGHQVRIYGPFTGFSFKNASAGNIIKFAGDSIFSQLIKVLLIG